MKPHFFHSVFVALVCLLFAVPTLAGDKTAGFSTSAKEFASIAKKLIGKSEIIIKKGFSCAEQANFLIKSDVRKGAETLNTKLMVPTQDLNDYASFITAKDQEIRSQQQDLLAPKQVAQLSVDNCGQQSASANYEKLAQVGNEINARVNGQRKMSTKIKEAKSELMVRAKDIKGYLLSCNEGDSKLFDSAMADLDRLIAKSKEVEKNSDILAKQFNSNKNLTAGNTDKCKTLVAQNSERDETQSGAKLPSESEEKSKPAAKEDQKKTGADTRASVAADVKNKKTARLPASIAKSTQNQQEFLKETEMVRRSQMNTAAAAQTEHYAELNKFAQEQGIQLPKNCLRGVFGSCANHVAAMRQLYLQGNTSLYQDYLSKLNSGSVKVGTYKFDFLGSK